MPAEEFQLTITARRPLTPEITEFVFGTGEHRIDAAPGAHITVATPSGARRRYSLTRTGKGLGELTIAVKRELSGRGGSASISDDTAVGDTIAVQPPENDFALVDAGGYLFVAGGIGITPILSMIRHLTASGHTNYALIYLTRDVEHTAFADEIAELAETADITVHHDNGDPDQIMDLWPVFEEPDDRHVYYCGPEPLMEDIAGMTGHWPEDQIHNESFAPAVDAVRADDAPFSVACARSDVTVDVGADESAMAALRRAGVNVPSSCESGSCGSCKTALISGDVEHRDLVLRDDEKTGFIMLCVSRATGSIVIDL